MGELGTNFSETLIKIDTFQFKKKIISTCSLENGGRFVSTSMCENGHVVQTSHISPRPEVTDSDTIIVLLAPLLFRVIYQRICHTETHFNSSFFF